MDAMIAFSSADGFYRLFIDRKTLDNMNYFCKKAGRRETGGILIGGHSVDSSTAIVAEATDAPLDSQSGPNWFRRGSTGLRELLENRWQAPVRQFYLGEWHYHPLFAPWPSGQDQQQMEIIANDPSYHCPEPILIIMTTESKRRKEINWVLRAYVFPSRAPVVELLQEHDLPGES